MTNTNPEFPQPADTESIDYDKESISEQLRALGERLDTIIDEADPVNDPNVYIDEHRAKYREHAHRQPGDEQEYTPPETGENYAVGFERTRDEDNNTTVYRVNYTTEVNGTVPNYSPYEFMQRGFAWRLDSEGNVVTFESPDDPDKEYSISFSNGFDIDTPTTERGGVSGKDALTAIKGINELLNKGLESPEGLRWEEAAPVTTKSKTEPTFGEVYSSSMRRQHLYREDAETNPEKLVPAEEILSQITKKIDMHVESEDAQHTQQDTGESLDSVNLTGSSESLQLTRERSETGTTYSAELIRLPGDTVKEEFPVERTEWVIDPQGQLVPQRSAAGSEGIIRISHPYSGRHDALADESARRWLRGVEDFILKAEQHQEKPTSGRIQKALKLASSTISSLRGNNK